MKKNRVTQFRMPKLVQRVGLPAAKDLGRDVIIIYDTNITAHCKAFAAWIKKFPHTYPVRGGEALKDVQKFPQHIHRILQLTDKLALSQMKLVVVGGGSVGDFGGFVASVLKRGVDLILIPSTWLAAIDSAHGGKTALNVGQAKNQIGTFYPAKKIYIVQDLLWSQPNFLLEDALSELYKIALLDKAQWSRRVLADPILTRAQVWRGLVAAIRSKYKIVKVDPCEKNGYRRLLNLGHTFGHIVEAHFKISHGQAVAIGLQFAILWSIQKGYLSARATWLPGLTQNLHARTKNIKLKNIPQNIFLKLANRDKKKTQQQKIIFIFIGGHGRCFQKEVALSEFLNEAKRQGYVD